MLTTFKNLSLAIVTLSILASCAEDKHIKTSEISPDLPSSIVTGANASPEDVKEYNGFLYTSNFFTGQITMTEYINQQSSATLGNKSEQIAIN